MSARQIGDIYPSGTLERDASEQRRREERRSVPELLGDLFDETRLLLREEVRLARAEIRERLEAIVRSSVLVLVGGVVGLAAALVLLSAANRGITVLLGLGMPATLAIWLGPLVFGVVLGLVAWGLIARGLQKLRKQSLTPEETIASLKENTEWLREKTLHH